MQPIQRQKSNKDQLQSMCNIVVCVFVTLCVFINIAAARDNHSPKSFKDIGKHENLDMQVKVSISEECLKQQKTCAPSSVSFTEYSEDGSYPRSGWIQDVERDMYLWSKIVDDMLKEGAAYKAVRLALDYKLMGKSERGVKKYYAIVTRVHGDFDGGIEYQQNKLNQYLGTKPKEGEE